TLDATGHWSFTLVNPLDHSPSPTGPDSSAGSETTFTLDLSGLFTAVEFDGETLALSGDVSGTIIDDSVQLVSGASSTGSVDEGALVITGTSGGTDLYGDGTDHGQSGAFVTTSGHSLSGLVNFGADGPDGTGGAVVNGSTNAFQFTAGTA